MVPVVRERGRIEQPETTDKATANVAVQARRWLLPITEGVRSGDPLRQVMGSRKCGVL
jgi:hypothetical protein